MEGSVNGTSSRSGREVIYQKRWGLKKRWAVVLFGIFVHNEVVEMTHNNANYFIDTTETISYKLLYRNHIEIIDQMTYPPPIKILNPKRTHGRYRALNWVPNQKVTITSLFKLHQT